MIKIKFEDLLKEFERALLKNGVNGDIAFETAKIFAENTLDGVYSHGVIRFPRVIEYIEKGYINPNSKPTIIDSFGAIERWNGNLGMGVIIAKSAMQRAIELSKNYGIGCIAVQNTNHWMRGGTYGWQAAEAGCIGICWTNTMPNMPAWGAKDRRIGNNPIVFSLPRKEGHIVADIAMSQFSYGQMESKKLKGELLPVPGGYDTEGKLSNEPAEIEKTKRVLPIGFWKGSGMSIALDLIAAILSGGNTVNEIGKLSKDEYGLSQVFIAIDLEHFDEKEKIESVIEETIENIKNSIPIEAGKDIFYPGENSLNRRNDNIENGIPISEEIIKKIRDI